MMPAEFDITGKVGFIKGAGRGCGKSGYLASAAPDEMTGQTIPPDGGLSL